LPPLRKLLGCGSTTPKCDASLSTRCSVSAPGPPVMSCPPKHTTLNLGTASTRSAAWSGDSGKLRSTPHILHPNPASPSGAMKDAPGKTDVSRSLSHSTASVQLVASTGRCERNASLSIVCHTLASMQCDSWSSQPSSKPLTFGSSQNREQQHDVWSLFCPCTRRHRRGNCVGHNMACAITRRKFRKHSHDSHHASIRHH
jgi:hypothetical protein